MGNLLKILGPILGITFWMIIAIWYFEYLDVSSTENNLQKRFG